MLRVKTLISLLLVAAALAGPGAAWAHPLQQTGPFEVVVAITLITPSPSFVGQPVTVTVQVSTVNPSGGIPVGTVNLTSSQSTLCTITLDATGGGSCVVTFSTPATVPLRAIYPGATAYLPGASAETYHQVRSRFPTSVTITKHDPFPSSLNENVVVQASVSSPGYPVTGSLTFYRSDETCAVPPPGFSDQCTAPLAAGSGSCSLPLSKAGAVTICAAYSGNVGNLPSVGQVAHWVSSGNTALGIQRVDPSPSLINQAVRVYFTLTSPLGALPASSVITITSGEEQCSATLAVGFCTLTLRQPHLQPVTATYSGSSGSTPVFQPATSNVWMQRVNAPPTSLALSEDAVDAFHPVGWLVGTFTTQDPNPDETHSYSLAAGAGASGNQYFEIVGNRLQLRRALPSGGGTLSIRVRTTDPVGLFVEAVFIIRVDRGELPATGFAPNVRTHLPVQPVGKTYTRLDAISVTIPRLGVSANVVGVPLNPDGWDAAWLAENLGWLNGTAFPTWQGNSVLVGHNFLADGSEGPFVHLSALRFGDQITVQAFGTSAVYEVRSVERLRAGDGSALRHEEKAWLTLITCRDFDEKLNIYRERVVVRAILVSAETP